MSPLITKMKLSDTRQPALTRAVIRQLGDKAQLEDVARHGADGGFPGFTYYSDTVPFAERHRDDIMVRLAEDSDACGVTDGSILSMLAGFGCLKGLTVDEIARGLYDKKADEHTQVFNALAWYALEEIARPKTPPKPGAASVRSAPRRPRRRNAWPPNASAPAPCATC